MFGKKLHWDMIPSAWQDRIRNTAFKSQRHRTQAIDNVYQAEMYERYAKNSISDDHLGVISTIKAIYHTIAGRHQDRKNARTIKGLMVVNECSEVEWKTFPKEVKNCRYGIKEKMKK